MGPDALIALVDRTLRVALGMATVYVLDAARELAAERGRPVMVIASRRQVECADAGGGYVGWSTAQWCAATGGTGDGIVLSRDHGGPYQHPRDLGEPDRATDFALDSLRCDIESGVPVLHVDTSLGADGTPQAQSLAVERAVELVGACVEFAGAAGRTVVFEVGFEVQAPDVCDPDEFAEQARCLLAALRARCGVTPAFLVAQTGTKVAGLGNLGAIHRRSALSPLRRLGAVVRELGCRLKAHNCDYLGPEPIGTLHRLGAWMNISPELGVAQTVAVLRAARAAGLDAEADRFSDEVLRAGHWRKWAAGVAGPVSDEDRVALGGSYLFGTPAFDELRGTLDHALRAPGGTRRIAVDAVKSVAARYA